MSVSRWPPDLRACRRCGRKPTEATYRGRGLCSYCWGELSTEERKEFQQLKRGVRILRDGWPHGLEACKRCGTHKSEVSYLGRGLCSRCVRKLRKEGGLDEWPIIRGESADLSAAGRQASPERKSRTSVARWIVSQVGLPRLAALVDLSVEEVRAWALGDDDEVPEEYRPLLAAERVRVRALTRRSKAYGGAGPVDSARGPCSARERRSDVPA